MSNLDLTILTPCSIPSPYHPTSKAIRLKKELDSMPSNHCLPLNRKGLDLEADFLDR